MAKDSQFVVMTIKYPYCKTKQKVHVGVNLAPGHMPNQYLFCINFDHEFDITLPDKIVRYAQSSASVIGPRSVLVPA